MNFVNAFASKTILTMQRLKPDWSMCLCWGIALSSANIVRYIWTHVTFSWSRSLSHTNNVLLVTLSLVVLLARIDLFCIKCLGERDQYKSLRRINSMKQRKNEHFRVFMFVSERDFGIQTFLASHVLIKRNDRVDSSRWRTREATLHKHEEFQLVRQLLQIMLYILYIFRYVCVSLTSFKYSPL